MQWDYQTHKLDAAERQEKARHQRLADEARETLKRPRRTRR